jgi:hypothetical protein
MKDLRVVAVADGFLRHQRFGRDGAEPTTKAYAHAIALFLRWCARTGRSWEAGVEQFALFMTWLAHAGPTASGADAAGAGSAVLLAGPGAAPARSASRINGVLTAVRGMVVHAVSAGDGPAGLVPLLYEVADDRDLPERARGEDGRMAWRMRARHRLRVVPLDFLTVQAFDTYEFERMWLPQARSSDFALVNLFRGQAAAVVRQARGGHVMEHRTALCSCAGPACSNASRPMSRSCG